MENLLVACNELDSSSSASLSWKEIKFITVFIAIRDKVFTMGLKCGLLIICANPENFIGWETNGFQAYNEMTDDYFFLSVY